MFVRSQRSLRARRATTRPLVPIAASIRLETLEERTLLSAVLPGLNEHGVVIGNGSVAGQQAFVLGSGQNPQLSGNANGSGLFINLNNQNGQISSLKELVIRDVVVADNGNAGIQIRLANMTLDRLAINRAAITGNGGSGLYLDLQNVRIGELIIWDAAVAPDPDVANSGTSTFSDNAFDGIHFQSSNSRFGGVRMRSSQMLNNAGHGVAFNLNNVFMNTLSLNDNEAIGNTAGSGFHFETNRANIGAVDGFIVNNTLTGNSLHGVSFVTQSLLPGSVPTLSPSNFDFSGFYDNTITDNQGSGVSVDLRPQTTWDATLLRNTISGNQLRGFDLKSIDTESAFDIQIGSLAVNPQQQLINGNTFDANVGAAIALELTDSTGGVANSTARFRILGNTITNTVAQAGSPVFHGEGINISARGDVSSQNGAARYFQSVIDRNIITANAGDGVRLNITEDSELIDLTIGNTTGRQQTFDINGDATGGGNVPTVAGDGNLISGNGGNGISLFRRGSAYIKDIKIFDNQITANADGIYVQASNSYVTVPNAARPDLPVVTDVTINRNTIQGNLVSGVHLRTEFDAVLLANLRYNRIDGNIVNGIRVTGLENNIPDFENVGGTWIKNAITNNGLNGIAIEGVVGSVNPLVIGQDGVDVDGQSLGNFIASNGEDGIEIGARAGAGGTVVPRDIRDAVDIINNAIVNNGRNAVGDPYTAGKGIDIELVASVVLNRSGQTREFRIDRNVIQGNAGDGLEINNRGGQLRLSAQGNFIDLNGGRGVDLLNQAASAGTDAEAYVRFGGPDTADRNIVTRNGLEGVYVVNTPSPGQTQDVPAEDPMVTWDISGSRLEAVTTVNLILDFENNEVRDNGGGLPGSPASTFSSAGLIIRAGSQYSASNWSTIADLTGYADAFSIAAAAGVGTNGYDSGGTVERDYRVSANGRVNARIVDNEFSGNGGDDVLIEGYRALIPRGTSGEWSTQFFRNISVYDRDPLARINLEFHGNTGDSLDVVRTQAGVDGEIGSYTNAEGDFKSRTVKDGDNPDGPFGSSQAGRNRVVTRVADRGAGGAGLGDAYNQDLRLGFTGVGGSFSNPTNGPNRNTTGGSLDIATIDGMTGGAIVVTVAARTGEISSVETTSDSLLFTSANHGLFTGDEVTVAGATGLTSINGIWLVTRISNDTFRLRDPATDAFLTGTAADYNDGSADWSLLGQHRLSTGDLITISGASFFGNANGVHMIRVVDAASFELYVPTDIGNLFGLGTLVPVLGNGAVTSGGTITVHNRGKFQYDGLGPSTLRIEGNWDTTGFKDRDQGDDFDETWSEGVSPIGVGWSGAAADTFSFLTASISDVTVNEADGTAFVTVTLSEDAPPTGLTVYYMTSDGSAKADPNNDGNPADGDYTPVSEEDGQFIVFSAGQRTATIEIDINDEDAFDGIEQFYVDLYRITEGDFVDSRAVVTIEPDADATPSISIGDIVVDEINGTATFTVELSNASSDVVSVDYTTVGGTAVDGLDFAGRGGTIAFAPGETQRPVTVVLVTDTLDENDEQFQVQLSNAGGATIIDASATATIRDSRYFSVSDVVINEGGTATVTISLNEALPGGLTASVDWATANSTATAIDYVAESGHLIFGGGVTSQTITIDTNTDLLKEGDEVFLVNLTGATNAGVAKGSGRITIVDPWEAESTVDFGHQIGRADGDGWSANTVDDSPGFLVYGPYTTIVPGGLQKAIFRLQVNNVIANNAKVARIDVRDATNGRTLAQRVLTRREFAGAFEYQDFDLLFNNTPGTELEFRVFWYGTSYVKADSIRVTTATTPALTFEAETDLSHQVGQAAADGWTANIAQHSAGYMAFGPYTTDVPAGPQSASFRLLVDNNTANNANIVVIDVFDATIGRVLAQQIIQRRDFDFAHQYQDFTLDFVNTAGRKLEFRVFWYKTSFVKLDAVIVTANPTPPLVNFEAETIGGVDPNGFYHLIGRRTADGWSANTIDDPAPGYMAHGPYTTDVPAGSHAALFRLLVDNNTANNAPIVTIDVVENSQVLARRVITRQQFTAAKEYQNFALNFTNSAGTELQFRVFWHGTSFVQFDHVAILDYPDPQVLAEAEGDRSRHQVGRADGDGWSANVVDDSPGYLVYGPWTAELATGAYKADFRLLVDNVTANNAPIVTIDVVDSITGQVLAAQVITRKMFNQAHAYQNFSLNFTATTGHAIEFRTFWHGTSYVKQDRVSAVPANLSVAELDTVFTDIDELLLMS